jgi:hypothetical protein
MSILKDKLYNYETTPPESTWEKIANALDESHLTNSFPEKLYELEVAPPASIWTAIQNNLDTESNTSRVIPMRKRVAGFWRYAAAAVLLIIAGYVIVEWTGNKNASGDSTLVVAPDSSTNKDNELAKSQPAETPVMDPETNTSSPVIEESLQPATTTGISTNNTRKKNITSPTQRRTLQEPIYASYEPANVAERYVMLLTPTGNIIRMSKKLGDMICCVSGEEQDNECSDQIKKWQEKLASSPSTSTGGFMDILSLVSALDNDL